MSRTPGQSPGTPGPTPNPARPAAARPAGGGVARPAGTTAGAAAKPAAAAPVPAPKPAAATTASAGAPGAPAAAAVPTPAPANPNRRKLILGGSAAGALALLVLLFVWEPWAPSTPRLNEDPALIAKFAASSSLRRLPFDQQRQYMELLDEKDKRVEEAYEQGTLSDQEYRRALQLAWYGEHLKKMDNFHSKPPTLRAMYLDKQVDKKIRKKRKNKDEPDDAKAALKAGDIERDDSPEEQDVQRWPSDVRQRWADYRAAYAGRKQYWKDVARDQKSAQEASKGAGVKGAAAEGSAPPDPAKDPEAAATGNPGGTQ